MEIKLSKRSAKDLSELIEKFVDLDYLDNASAQTFLNDPSDQLRYKAKITLDYEEGVKKQFRYQNGAIKISIEEI